MGVGVGVVPLMSPLLSALCDSDGGSGSGGGSVYTCSDMWWYMIYNVSQVVVGGGGGVCVCECVCA